MILGLAPMDGVTDFPFRSLVQDIFKKYKKSDQELWSWTEFMSADGYMINPSRLIKHLITNSDEQNLIAQIYGGNIDTLIKTAQDIEYKYPSFAGIELNIGCPSPKVLSCGAGAGMMKDKDKTLHYIRSLSESISLPFSIKTRAGLNEADKESQYDFIVQASQYCHMISIHGRTYTQGHSGEVDRDMLYRIKKDAHPDCRIIGNGGIQSYHDIQINLGNLDGIMIGQAAIHMPWIFVDHVPNREEKKSIAQDHLIRMIAYEIYMDHTRTQYPEVSDQIAINRQSLHLLKKYDPDSDEFHEAQPIDFHDYVFPMPDQGIINEYRKGIQQQISGIEHVSTLSLGNNHIHLNQSRTAVNCRKYLFGYIKGHPRSKELKQQLISTKNLQEIYHAIGGR